MLHAYIGFQQSIALFCMVRVQWRAEAPKAGDPHSTPLAQSGHISTSTHTIGRARNVFDNGTAFWKVSHIISKCSNLPSSVPLFAKLLLVTLSPLNSNTSGGPVPLRIHQNGQTSSEV